MARGEIKAGGNFITKRSPQGKQNEKAKDSSNRRGAIRYGR